MAAKIPSYAPNDYLFVTEGLAELTVGADDTRDLIKLLKNPERLSNSFKNPNKSEYGYYGAGYMFFRYFAKQVADAKNIKTNQTMTFSQPKEIGSFVLLQVGHNSFEIKGAVYNSDRAKIDSYSGRTYYTNGIARFGDDKSEIWLHYNKNSRPAYCRLGGENFSDTIPEDFSWGHKIFYIGGVNGFKFYALRSQFDMPSAQIKYEYNIIGRKPDGTWLKYFNTRKIIEKYIAKGYGYSMQDLNVSGDTIIIKYKILEYKYKKIYNGQSGELRFKWDESAQWFDVEHIVY